MDKEQTAIQNVNVIIDKGCYMPERAYPFDAGMDLRTPRDVIVPAGGSAVIDTGVHVEIPQGYVGMLKSKSGLNVKQNLISEGVIDCGFTGSIVCKLYNLGKRDVTLLKGSKITQIVIMPVLLPNLTMVDRFEETDRGNNGFGSTGI